MSPIEELRKTLAEKSLRDFIRMAWPLVDPAEYVPGWHIDAICDHLEAVSRGDIKRLIINIPPRHMKSSAVSIFWPAWTWGPQNRAHTQWLFTSYAANLSVRDSVKSRRLMDSDWYRNQWGDRVEFASDQNTKIRYENTANGQRIASSVDGTATGEGGDIIVIDDPHNVRDADSVKVREGTCQWFDEVMTSRLNNPKTGAFVLIMQRVHERDLTGHILAKNSSWDHLCLPAEYEPNHPFVSNTKLGFVDPRSVDGEPLWPDRFSTEQLAESKKSLGSYAAAGQFQQRPAPREGGMVKLNWFKRFRTQPAKDLVHQTVQSWDTASKAGVENAYSVCGTWLITETGFYLIHVLRERLNLPDLLRTTISHAHTYSPDAVLIEDKASGIGLIQHLQDETNLAVIAIQPKGDKVTRMERGTPTMESGRVYLPEDADWLIEYESEIRNFPNSANADQVDMTSQFLDWVKDRDQVLEFF